VSELVRALELRTGVAIEPGSSKGG
jgi:hypothetical protein